MWLLDIVVQEQIIHCTCKKNTFLVAVSGVMDLHWKLILEEKVLNKQRQGAVWCQHLFLSTM